MVRSIICFSFIFMFLCGCSNGNSNDASTIIEKEAGKEEEMESGKLDLQFDVYVTDSQVHFNITLANNSNETKKLEFPSSQKYEIIITDENNQEIYRYSEGKMFTQAIEYALIKQNESVEWEEKWEYKKEQIKPGKYSATVSILAKDSEDLIKTQTIQIPE